MTTRKLARIEAFYADHLSLSARRIERDAASGRLILIGEVEIGGQGARITADRMELLVPPNGVP